MRSVAKTITGPSRPLPAHQQLALAVIIQAIHDEQKSQGKVQAEARQFLASEATLYEWCGIAGLEPDFVRAVIRRSLEQGPRE